MSLFGKPAGAASGGSLFGGTTMTNSAPTLTTSGGLFGGGSTSQQQDAHPTGPPPAWDTMNAMTARPPLFPNAPGLASINQSFTQEEAAKNGITPLPTAGPAKTGAYFDSLLAKNKQQADGEGVLGELPSLQLGLGDLRQRLKKIGSLTSNRIVDGKAHYLLAASGVDPGAAVRDLGSLGVTARADRGQGLSGIGHLDVDTYLSSLQTKTTLSMIADGLDRSVRDFESFMFNNVTSEWEAQRKRIYQHFGITPREDSGRASAGPAARDTQGVGFGRSRRTGHFSNPPSTQKGSVFGRNGLQKSVIGAASRVGPHVPEFADCEGALVGESSGGHAPIEDRWRKEKQDRFAAIIRSLNDARIEGRSMFLAAELADLEQRSGDKHSKHVEHAYHALMEMVGEKAEADTLPRARQFAKMYLDPNPNSQNAVAMRKKILESANRVLEMRFLNHVDEMIAKHPVEANLGGRPDVVSKIRAYIRILQARKTFLPDHIESQKVGDESVWAVVFYLLRGGKVIEAVQYVNNLRQHFRSIDRTFSGYINSYASSEDRRLKRAMQERCHSEYNQRVRNAPEGSIDPFRMACYKVVGRCDLGNRSLDGLMTDVDDWIWLQFNLAREGERCSELASETYGLSELQSSICEIGAKHFSKASADDGSFGMFFYLQILSGLFEQAIHYLYSYSYMDAVHFAIALAYYGLLRPADLQSAAGDVLLSHNTRGLPQLNFGPMLGRYTRDFRAKDVASAVDYIALICLNADESGGNHHAELCYKALRELVLETREYSKLIGDISADGRHIRGVIEQRGRLMALGQEQDLMKSVTLQAATFADDNGRVSDAVLLYHLAGDYDTVVAILGRTLSEAITLEVNEEPMRLVPVKPRVAAVSDREPEAQSGSSLSLAAIDDPVELAKAMMGMYEKKHMFWGKIQDANRVACNILLQMSEIKAFLEAGKWALCLDKIKSLQILPLEARGDPSIIRTYASKFSALSQTVAVNVPNLLLWTIQCCARQKERLLSSNFIGNAATARELEEEVNQIGVDLITYTSQLRYRFPPHLHEALARASAD